MAAPAYPYVALRQILVDGVLAFSPGDPVPAQHVQDLGLEVGGDVELREIEGVLVDDDGPAGEGVQVGGFEPPVGDETPLEPAEQ